MSDEKKPISMIEGVGDRDERGLKCRDCGCRHFNVVHTRPAPDSLMRERQCRNCGKIIWTREKPA